MKKATAKSRREFLRNVAVAGGTGAVALGAAAVAEAAGPNLPEARPEAPRPKRGYRRTDHIDTYYRLARL